MQPADDSVLLRQYAESKSEEAFAALVSRHINLVYSVALRYVGDPHQAEEVSQAVFILLAKKAAQLRHDKALSSWLFQTTRLTASNSVRSETRRHRRELEAHMQSVLNDPGNDIWPRIAPMLDDAVAGLNEQDRHAIVLRFYEGRNLREVGAALGASEDAAEKRVSRALEKLRTFFAKRGVTVAASGLVSVLSANAVQAAPVGLATTVTAASLTAGAAVPLASTSSLLKLVASTKLKLTLAALAIGLPIALIILGWRTAFLADRDPTPLPANEAPAAGATMAVRKVQPQDFVGKWSGRWDKTWPVYFTISIDPQSEQLMALYEWEDIVGGRLKRKEYSAVLVDDVLRMGRSIELSLSTTESNRARAIGNFGNQRTADLIRE